MIRKAFVMSVHPGHEAEYERRHNPIWPELEAVLRVHGVQTYSIFLHPETRQLFAYVEFTSEAQWQAVASTDVCQRWWASMRELMPSNPDHSPVARELREVFHLAPRPANRDPQHTTSDCVGSSPFRGTSPAETGGTPVGRRQA